MCGLEKSIIFPRYTFQYSCDEEPQLKLKDGSLRIFLNTAAEELENLDQKLKAFYHYIQKGVIESDLTQDWSKAENKEPTKQSWRRHEIFLPWAYHQNRLHKVPTSRWMWYKV